MELGFSGRFFPLLVSMLLFCAAHEAAAQAEDVAAETAGEDDPDLRAVFALAEAEAAAPAADPDRRAAAALVPHRRPPLA